MATTIDGDGNVTQYNRDGSIRMVNEVFAQPDALSPAAYHDALYNELLHALTRTIQLGHTGIEADNYVKEQLRKWMADNPQPSCLPANSVFGDAEVARYFMPPNRDVAPPTLWQKIKRCFRGDASA